MNRLLSYLIENITGVKDFSIKEETDNGFTRFIVVTKAESAGLIIGKSGRTIKMIRSLLRVKATLEKTAVAVSVEGHEQFTQKDSA